MGTTQRTPQNFDNHAVVPRSWFAAALTTLTGVILAVIGLFMPTSTAGVCLIGSGAALVGVGGLISLGLARGYALTLQNRLIRAEMRARLPGLLPEDLRGRIAELSVKQLIGLRFASDGEMPDLVRRVLDENIEDATAIKRLVGDWQADHDRV